MDLERKNFVYFFAFQSQKKQDRFETCFKDCTRTGYEKGVYKVSVIRYGKVSGRSLITDIFRIVKPLLLGHY